MKPKGEGHPGKRQRSDTPPTTETLHIDPVELEAFRETLPEYRRYEQFRYLFLKWDIVKAQYLLQKYPHKQAVINVAQTAKVCGFKIDVAADEEPEDSGFFHVDTKTVMSDDIDLSRPLILALLLLPGKNQAQPLLIDGLHRVFKATRKRMETLPCFALTPEEEQLCRM